MLEWSGVSERVWRRGAGGGQEKSVHRLFSKVFTKSMAMHRCKMSTAFSYEDIDAMESPDKVSESMRRKERRL